GPAALAHARSEPEIHLCFPRTGDTLQKPDGKFPLAGRSTPRLHRVRLLARQFAIGRFGDGGADHAALKWIAIDSFPREGDEPSGGKSPKDVGRNIALLELRNPHTLWYAGQRINRLFLTTGQLQV